MTLKGHTSFVYGVAFSPDGKWLASASWDGSAKVWDATSGPEFRALNGHTGSVNDVAFSPDGTRLVSGGPEVKLWDLSGTANELTD
jgi:WD40 repeat protein